MSSKKHHIITRDNYEEYFLLYIDDELNAEMRGEVESFVMLHPDLQEELELLQGTRLESEDFVFEGKENLLSGHLDITDESLLSFIDNELNPDETRRVEFEINNNPTYFKGYQQLQAAKLDPEEVIVCPFKNELYHHEISRKPIPWLRVAAAAILLAGGGSILVLSNRKNIEPPTAHIETKKPVNNTAVKVEDYHIPETATVPQEQTARIETRPEKQIKRSVSADPEPVKSNHLPVPQPRTVTPDQDLATLGGPDIDLAVKRQTNTTVSDRSIQNSNQNTVTNPVVTASNPIATTNAEPAVNYENNSGKSVRGFLRKATRFIERRTGINPVNDDDKLLVGVVAINLK